MSTVWPCISHAKRKKVMSSGRDFISDAWLSSTVMVFPLEDKKAMGVRLERLRMEESTASVMAMASCSAAPVLMGSSSQTSATISETGWESTKEKAVL